MLNDVQFASELHYETYQFNAETQQFGQTFLHIPVTGCCTFWKEASDTAAKI